MARPKALIPALILLALCYIFYASIGAHSREGISTVLSGHVRRPQDPHAAQQHSAAGAHAHEAEEQNGSRPDPHDPSHLDSVKTGRPLEPSGFITGSEFDKLRTDEEVEDDDVAEEGLDSTREPGRPVKPGSKGAPRPDPLKPAKKKPEPGKKKHDLPPIAEKVNKMLEAKEKAKQVAEQALKDKETKEETAKAEAEQWQDEKNIKDGEKKSGHPPPRPAPGDEEEYPEQKEEMQDLRGGATKSGKPPKRPAPHTGGKRPEYMPTEEDSKRPKDPQKVTDVVGGVKGFERPDRENPGAPGKRKHRYAIATSCWDSPASALAVMLGWSIKQHNNVEAMDADMVLLTLAPSDNNPSLTAENRTILEKAGWTIREIPLIDFKGVEYDKIRPKHRFNLNKLHLFSWDQYEKIVFLDADTIVKGPIKEMLDMPGDFAAVSDSWPDVLTDAKFNSGVMVFRPKQEVFDDMVAKVPDEQYRKPEDADDVFLQTYFQHWDYRMPKKFNLNLVLYEHHHEHWRSLWGKAAVVHMTTRKPTWDEQNFCRKEMKCAEWEPMNWYKNLFDHMRNDLKLQDTLLPVG